MKDIFWNKHRKFSIRKLKIGIASVTVGLVFVNSVTGMNHVEAALSVEDSNYINETAVNNGALVEYIRQALATISKAANSTVLPSSIQNLKEKVQALSTKKEADYTESAWQEFQGKLTTAKSVLAEAEKAYNKAVTINPSAQSYETTINELITSYPEYNTVVIKVREGESGETAENRHLTNLRRINGVLSAKYSELSETAQSLKNVLPSFGEDLATQQLKIIESAENILEVNKKTKTLAETEHADLMAGLFENHKVTLSDLSALRGTITSADQSKITAFLESHNPSVGETAVFQTYVGALQYQFNNNGTVTITYTDDGSSDTVPLSIFAKGGAAQTESLVATYSVTYNYVSGTPDKSLPSNITAPAAVSDKHTGDVVASPSGQTDVEDTANQGTWHFNGWDKASVTIGTANETVIGTWNFIPTPPAATYGVTYNYVSGTPDKSLPSSITAPAAVSDKHTGDVVASPSGQTDVEDAANQGTWHFNGWDKASVTIGTTNETVTGTWNFIPTPPAATYTVTYNYVSGTPDKSLPSSITAPAAVSDKHTGDVVASPSGQADVIDATNQGTWHFNGWDKASVTVRTSDETVTGIWTFTATPVATYSVTYNYVSGTPDKSLPSSITAPATVSDQHTGDVVASPSGQVDTLDSVNQGTWHFKGWDKASVTIVTANETVIGTWNFIPTPPAATYTVTYNYVSGTPDKSLPSNITAPAAVNDKHTGDVVASPSGQTDVEDTANQGAWHFKGWDKASVTIGTTNETVTGTWNFIPTPPAATYTVTYNYVSGTPDKSLPSSITAPAAVSDKHTGDVVASPSGQTDVEDTANQGTWHFNGWDKASVTIGTANETVIGTWNFIPTPPAATYGVTYNYVSGTPDKSLPSSITAPAAVSDKHTGDVVASPSGQVDTLDSVNQGTWHFKGWDKASVTIATANETVTGTWNFIPTPPAATYTVTYNYVSGTPDKSLPSSITAPVAVSDQHTGDVVASPSGQTDVEDTANQGTWHFKGWDKASVTVETSDETVTGIWTFTATPVATYSVTYNYVSGTPDKSLPSSITAPATVSDQHTGDVVASPSGQVDTLDSVNQGTWHFKGWDKASVTIVTANETVIGTWNFIPTPPAATYTVTYNYVSGTPDKSLPSSITAPAAVSDKHTGDVVASPSGQADVIDATNQGTWHFKGWDKASVTIGTANETVIGTWNFIPTPPAATYTVTYNYVSGTPDKSLPSSTLPTTIGWIKEDNRWWYKHADGSYTANDWEQIKGIWYHFDQSGWMQTGWIQDKGTWYYLNKSGAMAIGWIQENGRWYYLNNSGAMKTGWVKDNDTWYYLDNSGAMKTGWFKVSGKWYYAYSSGALAVDTTVDGYTVNANGEWV